MMKCHQLKGFITASLVFVSCFLGAQSISSFTPATGSVGSLLTINGANFGSATSVTVGAIPAIIISKTTSKIVVMVMPGTPTGAVKVFGSFTATAAGNFTVITAPIPSLQQGTKNMVGINTGYPWFGKAVAVSADGNTAIIGCPREGDNIGGAYIYVRTGSIWSRQGVRLVGTGYSGNPNQGESVAISADGNTVIVGGPDDEASLGAAWIFTRSGTTWTQQGAKLRGSGALNYPQQGHSVSLSGDGNTAVIGGPGDYPPDHLAMIGAVWVFNRTGTTWTQKGNKLVGTPWSLTAHTRQGYATAISADGKTIVAGAPGESKLFVYSLSAGVWSQQGDKFSGVGADGTAFGTAVALSADGNTVIAGAQSDNNAAGAAWVFTRSGVAWSQQGPKLVGNLPVTNNLQGYSVSISADGNSAIVGGHYYGSLHKGGAWVYSRNGGVWKQAVNKLQPSDGNGTALFGTGVSISADGNTALMGGPEEDNGGAFWAFVGCTLPEPTANAGNVLATLCQGESTPALGGSFGGSAVSATWGDNGAGGQFTDNGGTTPGTVIYTPPSTFTGTIQLQLTTAGGSCANAIAIKSLQVSNTAVTSTWLGVTNDWNTPTNWSTGAVPNGCTKVIVNAGIPQMPTVTGISNICQELTLNNGAKITMGVDAKLSILKK